VRGNIIMNLKEIFGESVGWIVVCRYRENLLALFRGNDRNSEFTKCPKFLEWRRKKDPGTWSAFA
jgi:hypothetical protein